MERTLPRPWSIPWRPLLLALYVGVNLALISMVRPNEAHPDWQLWVSLPDKLASGTLYAQTGETRFAWSPLFAPVMALAPVVGYWTWMALHVAPLLLLRDWRLIGLVLVSWGFWIDTIAGNTFGWVFVAAVLAMRGSRVAALVLVVLTVAMPRPIVLPLVGYLLWVTPALRWQALAAFVVHAAGVALTGYADEWIGSMLLQTGPIIGNVGPTLLFGKEWMIVGIPLALYLVWRRELAWAGVCVSPYMLPAYWLWPLVPQQREVDDRLRDQRVVDQAVALGSR